MSIDDTPEIEVDETARSTLHALYERDGKLTAETVVDEARVPGSPLSRYFEWDDEIAAHGYRLVQARELIRRYTVTILDHRVRAFTYVPSTGSYHPIRDAMSDKDWRAEIVAHFERDAAAFESRWKDHKFVADHFREWINSKANP